MPEILLEMLSPISIIELAVISFLIYKIINILQGTRAVQIIKGLAVLLVVTLVSRLAGLTTLNWLLERFQTVIFISIPIVFQPELRRALERLGSSSVLGVTEILGDKEREELVDSLTEACFSMASQRIGALIVIEGNSGIVDIVETGTKMESLVSRELLENIFVPKTPLHDGAVIIEGNRIKAASCYLPLSQNPRLGRDLGTRHRAGLGVTEISDAVSIIVSEETGIVSIAREGKLTRYLDSSALKGMLLNSLKNKDEGRRFFWKRRGE